MSKRHNLILLSFHHSGKNPLWWFLGFLQINTLVLLLQKQSLFFLKFFAIGAFPILFFLFNIVTYILWLGILKVSLPEKDREKVVFSFEVFLRLCLVSGLGLLFCIFMKNVTIPALLKLILVFILEIYVCFVMLFIVLKNCNLVQSVVLSVDFFRKKAVIILGFFSGLFLAQIWLKANLVLKMGFSELFGSAIILSVLIVFQIGISLLIAVINCWLVLFFLAQTDTDLKTENPEVLENTEAEAVAV